MWGAPLKAIAIAATAIGGLFAADRLSATDECDPEKRVSCPPPHVNGGTTWALPPEVEHEAIAKPDEDWKVPPGSKKSKDKTLLEGSQPPADRR